MMGNMQKMMEQARRMQTAMAKVQQELENVTIEGSAGGGAVKVTANGQQTIQSIKIDPSCIDPEDMGLLEDLVLSAVNDALNKSSEEAKKRMSSVTGGMKIPGLF